MSKLAVIERELVPVYETDKGEKVVYGSELHDVLCVGTPYRMWVDRRLDECDAVEDSDFKAEQICSPSGQMMKEHIIKLDTAKEMAMLERNEKGKQVRRYFIEVEKRYKDQDAQRIRSGPAYNLKEDFEAMTQIATFLNMSWDDKRDMAEAYLTEKGITTCFLPGKRATKGADWNRKVFSAANLLKKNEIEMPYTKFLDILVEAGYMKVKEGRRSYSPDKKTKYKAFTMKGSAYGKDVPSDSNKYITVPRFYEDSFMDLYNAIF